MSSGIKWLASTLFVALLVWVAWGVRGGLPERPEVGPLTAEVERSEQPVEAPAELAAPLDEPQPDPVDAEDERVPAGPAAAAGDSTPAKIALRVVAKGSGAPVSSVRVDVYAILDGPRRPQIAPTAKTDAEGRVELEVRAWVRLMVSASGVFGARSEGEEPIGFVSVELEPLSPGERREVTIEVPVGRDLVFFGRVVDAVTGAPIPRARAVEAPGDLEVVADGAGMLELHVPSWRPGAFELSAEGFGLRRFTAAVGHERVETARTLPLLPAATLRVRVLDEGPEPLDTLSVRLSAKSYELEMPDESLITSISSFSLFSYPGDELWRASCAIDGTCELTGLPARVPLEAELLRDRRVVLQAGSLGLEPGEVREVEWRLNSGTRVVGVVIDQHGAPVARCALGRFSPSAAPGTASDRWLLMEHTYDQAVATAVSDAEGRFAFEDVIPGSWWIGPCPPEGDAAEVPALATRVEVPAGVLEYPIELRVERGSFIGGRVFTPDGSVPKHAWLMAFGDSMGGAAYEQMRNDGSFQLGPLPSGSYRLQAQSIGEYTSSREVVAFAGDEGVVLRLEWAGKLAGEVVEPREGLGCPAELTICGAGDRGLRMLTSTDQDGSFELEGLAAGDYDLTAVSSDGLVAVLRGVTVTPNATNAGLRLELQPGARVEVRYEGARDYGHYEIRSEGTVVVIHSMKRGATAVHTVPPGAIEVQLTFAGEPVEPRRLELRAGDEGKVVFAPDE